MIDRMELLAVIVLGFLLDQVLGDCVGGTDTRFEHQWW